MFRLVYKCAFAMFLGGLLLGLVSEKIAGAGTLKENLIITSAGMTVKGLEDVAVFDGNVVMTKGDLTLRADHAEVKFRSQRPTDGTTLSARGFFSSNARSNQVQISTIHATGNVRLRQGQKHGEADEAIYYHDEGKVVMMGDPHFTEKDYQVSGTKITLFINEARSVVEGSKVRVYPGADSE